MKNILIGILIIFSLPAISQPLKFRTKIFSMVLLDKTGNFVYESKEEKSNVLVVLSPEKENITLYTDKEKVISIIKTDTYEDSHKFTWASMQCIDNEGLKCGARLVWYGNSGNDGFDASLYIDYNNYVIIYKMLKE